MTVQELIERLEKCNPDAGIFIPYGVDGALDFNVVEYSDCVYLEEV